MNSFSVWIYVFVNVHMISVLSYSWLSVSLNVDALQGFHNHG